MRKNKEYISDVQQKIIELHKLESGFKKRARAVKIPISTIRAIIKKFQSTENVMNPPGNLHGEEESLSGQRLFKDHSWRIAEKG